MPISTTCHTAKDKTPALNPDPIEPNVVLKTEAGCGLPKTLRVEMKLNQAITELDSATATGTDAVLINSIKTTLSEILAALQ
jgi:hypothetical protein